MTRARWTFVVLTALFLAVAWMGRHHTWLRWGGALSALSLCAGYLVSFGRSLARPRRLNLVGPHVPQARRLSDLAAELAARTDRRDGWINLLPLVVLLSGCDPLARTFGDVVFGFFGLLLALWLLLGGVLIVVWLGENLPSAAMRANHQWTKINLKPPSLGTAVLWLVTAAWWLARWMAPLVVLLAPALAWAQEVEGHDAEWWSLAYLGCQSSWSSWAQHALARRWWWGAGGLLLGLGLGVTLGVWGLLRWLAAAGVGISRKHGWWRCDEIGWGPVGESRRWWWQALADAWRLSRGGEVR